MMRALHRRCLVGCHWRPAPWCARVPIPACSPGIQVLDSRNTQHASLTSRCSSRASHRIPPHSPFIVRNNASGTQAPPTAPTQDLVLLLGFTPEDLHVMHHNVGSLFPGLSPDLIGVVTQPLAQHSVSHLVSQLHLTLEQAGAEEPDSSSDTSAHGPVLPGRVVYLVEGAAAFARDVNDVLVQMGVAPAVVAALQPKHLYQRMCDVADGLRAAHARYWELVRPVELLDTLDDLIKSAPAQPAAPQHETPSDVPLQAPQEHVLDALSSSRVVLSAIMDAGEVPCSTGGWRHDEAHMVVLDGLLTESERQSLLDWLTTPGHDHNGPPPDDKWEQSCVDREGDAASWGLRPHMLAALEESPPPAVVALQTRLSALYPEYTLCHMPADVISSSEEDVSLSTFVGNAIMQGDPCAWHDDADPAILPPSSPWVHCYGYYYNREPGKPRFVSLLLYLNESWPEELHAETMFLDPTAQAGLFVRPTPGRVVLMDQDMPHRICAPSQAAGPAPRYSLVWKMVWLPKHDPTLPGVAPSSAPTSETGLCRQEWGAPIRLGSAGELMGKPAWERK